MYGDWRATKDQIQFELDRTLNPRSSWSLFDTMGSLGFGAGSIWKSLLHEHHRFGRQSINVDDRSLLHNEGLLPDVVNVF